VGGYNASIYKYIYIVRWEYFMGVLLQILITLAMSKISRNLYFTVAHCELLYILNVTICNHKQWRVL